MRAMPIPMRPSVPSALVLGGMLAVLRRPATGLIFLRDRLLEGTHRGESDDERVAPRADAVVRNTVAKGDRQLRPGRFVGDLDRRDARVAGSKRRGCLEGL